MDNRIKHIARLGYTSKGVVYGLTGLLAFGAAIGFGKNTEGKLGVLKFLEEQPFGKVLLGVMGMGLLCYAFWRFFQSIKDPEEIGNEKKGIGKRLGFFVSGLIYLAFGIFSIYEIFNETRSGGMDKINMFPPDYLPYIFYAVAVGITIKSIFQFVKVFKGDFLLKFNLYSRSNIETWKTIKWLGYVGLISRGIVLGIVAFILFKAADNTASNDIKGTSDAFSFLRQNSEGPWLVGLVALGLICYGTFMFIMAKYRRFDA